MGLLSRFRRTTGPDDLATFLAAAEHPTHVIDSVARVAELDARPAPATLVDALSENRATAMRRARRLFWHVSTGGRYVTVAPDDDVAARIEAAWRDLVSDRAGRVPGVRPRLRRELRRAVGSIRREGRLVIVEKVGQSLFKVAESERHLVAQRTRVSMEVVERREASVFVPARRMVTYGEQPSGHLEQWQVPVAEVRHYSGPVTLGEGMVVTADETLLPESFKWFEHRPLENSQLADITPRFARVRRPSGAEPRRLGGSYYLFEYKNSGHYGHLLTEGLAKLWGWEQARQVDPDVRLAIRRHKRDRGKDTVRPDVAILDAYGVRAEDVVWLEEPVTVDTLFTATPQLHNKEPYSIDPRIVDVWDRVLHGLLAHAPGASDVERIFVTRRAGHRLCHNWAEVEHEVEAAGFTVVEPARLTLPEQARTFRDARVVGGFGGTGLFNLIFADQAPPVIVLGHTAYDARNEELITAARDSDLHCLWSTPDRAQPAKGFDYRAFQSPWTFDSAQHTSTLRELLRAL